LDWLQLSASIIDSLAWPLTVAVGIYLLRRPLLALLPNLRQFKYKDLEVQFGEQLDKLEHELEQHAPPEEVAAEPDLQPDEREKFDLLAAISPNAAVLEAWTDIERKVHILAARHNLSYRSIRYATQVLRNKEIISPRLSSLLADLRGLRNMAAHPPAEWQITLDEAHRYKEVVDQVGYELQSILDQPREP
jgi:hypothetical protein